MEIPRIITKQHLKKRALIGSGKTLKEGVIEELSPSGKNVRIGAAWHENAAGLVVELLPDLPKTTKPSRFTPGSKK